MTVLLQMMLYAPLAITIFFSGDLSAEGLSFLEVFEEASGSAPELALARYTVDGADARRLEARSKLLPQVNLFGQWSRNELSYSSELSLPDVQYPGQRFGLQLKQSLMNDADRAELKRQELLFKQSREELTITEAQLFGSLTNAYLNILLGDMTVEQLRLELDALNKQLDETRAFFEKKLTPLTDVLETEARRDAVLADIVWAKGDAAVAREELWGLSGLVGVEPIAVNTDIALMSMFESPEAAATVAVNRSASVASARLAVSAAKKAVDRERGTWFPEIDLIYSYQVSDVGFDNLAAPSRDTSTLAIGVNYPIFEGFAGKARLKGVWAEYFAAKTRLTAVERESSAAARTAWVRLSAAVERLNAAKKSVASSATNLDAARKAVSLGAGKVSDVLIALSQSSSANRELAAAKFGYVNGWVELELSTGALPSVLASKLSAALHDNP